MSLYSGVESVSIFKRYKQMLVSKEWSGLSAKVGRVGMWCGRAFQCIIFQGKKMYL